MTTPSGATRRFSAFLALAAAIVAVLVVLLLADTVRGVVHRRAERHGTVTVSHCDFRSFGRHVNSYSCLGGFASDDGELRRPVVRFVHTGSLDPGDKVAGTVAGPDDDSASLDSEFALVWRLVFAACGTVLVVAALVRRSRLRPAR